MIIYALLFFVAGIVILLVELNSKANKDSFLKGNRIKGKMIGIGFIVGSVIVLLREIL